MVEEDDPNWINYTVLRHLAGVPHSNILDVTLPPNVHHGVGEVLTQAKVAHHLLTLHGIPEGAPLHRLELDERVFLIARRLMRTEEVLDRVASRHAREMGEGGLVGAYCMECGQESPCETYILATEQLGEEDDGRG